MVNKYKEMKQEFKRNINVASNLNPSYLLSNLDKLNLHAASMENILGRMYKTQLINCHCRLNGFDAVFRSTVNLEFLRLQPRITIIQKIQQGTKNEGKWK